MTPQELKESILWNAIQGKFTTQFQSETITEIIGRAHISPVEDEDAYFDIPRNWCWARIGEIFDLVNGKAFKPTDWSEQGIPIVRIQNLNDPNAPFNYFTGKIEEKYLLHGGELLFSWSGTPGTSFGAFIWDGGQAVLNQHIFIVYPKVALDYEYAKYALNGELRIFIAKAHGGAGLKHITRKEFDSCFLPIPPLAEQKRIVAKIEKLLPYIDRYEKAWSKLKDLNKRFPGDMQKSVLQMAIQGKLVEQRPEEGTGEELYRQIQAEKQTLIKSGKIKKEKPLPEISEDEIPFDIPESWRWVRLRDLGVTQTGNTPPKSHPEYFGQDIPFITPGDIALTNIDYNNQGISSLGENVARICDADSILQVCIGGSIGKAAITNRRVAFNQQINTITPLQCLSKYLFSVFQSAYFITAMKEKAGGTATPIINRGLWDKLLIPLPPLAEQKRIVQKLEEILPLCERLK